MQSEKRLAHLIVAANSFRQIRLGNRRTHRIDAKALARILERHRFRKTDNGKLARVVNRFLPVGRIPSTEALFTIAPPPDFSSAGI